MSGNSETEPKVTTELLIMMTKLMNDKNYAGNKSNFEHWSESKGEQ